jgi:isopentenyl-diphosphate Delta-isomerase
LKNIEINEVILVNLSDEDIGSMEKLEAHEKGLLHRAFSVLLFNSKKELLLQKRALGKYHSEGLWTNTCCSHPSPGESIIEAANRRLMEEMGLNCTLQNSFSFVYKIALDNNLIEHEFDHVVIGKCDVDPVLNVKEASDYSWVSLAQIQSEIVLNPDKYTCWFKIIIGEHFEKLNESLKTIFNESV